VTPCRCSETADAMDHRLLDGALSVPRWRRVLVARALLVLAALVLGYTAGVVIGRVTATSRSAQTTEAVDVSGPSSAALTGVPPDPALVPAAATADVRPVGAPSPAAATTQPTPTVVGSATPGASMSGFDAWMRDGLLAWADESHGPAYLAVPWGPGYLVTVCGPGGCLTLTSTDAGPDLAMQRARRVGDLAVGLWESVCGVPRTIGLCPASVVVKHRP